MKKFKTSSLTDLILSFSSKERIQILTVLFKEISAGERFIIFKKVFPHLALNERKKINLLILKTLYSKTRWAHIEKWMESTLTNHYDYTPYKVAMMAMNYYRVNRKMKPLMISLARKIKKRVYYRLKKLNK